MPTLLDWQVQLLSLQLVNQPETKQILSDTERLTRSTEAFAQLTDQLPKLVNDQREAAIQQILEGLASERTNLLASLAAEEQKARALLAEARETLNAGSQMAVSANTAIQSLDAFVRSVSPATNRNDPLHQQKALQRFGLRHRRRPGRRRCAKPGGAAELRKPKHTPIGTIAAECHGGRQPHGAARFLARAGADPGSAGRLGGAALAYRLLAHKLARGTAGHSRGSSPPTSRLPRRS